MDGIEGKDESSIRPVSSLRSRFENLQKDNATPPVSPIVGRSPFALGPAPGPIPRSTTPIPLRGQPEALPAPVPRRREAASPIPRPHSMVTVTPSQNPPPLLTVNSPYSPERRNQSVDLRLSPAQTQALTPSAAAPESPTKSHARTISRATTPGIEARMSALLQPVEVGKAQSEGTLSRPATPDVKAQPHSASGPPPVNRAGKPKIPTKPPALAQKPDGLSALEPKPEPADHGPSPFSTPPGSGTSSPRRPSDQARVRGDSNASAIQRVRTDSDASFVERIRTNSSASGGQRGRFDSSASIIERARAGSNASFVEPSSLPDTWHHFQTPPLHHQAGARREQQPNGASRPARYRPVAASEMTVAGDLSDDRPRLPSRPELQTRSGRTSPAKVRSGRTSPVKQMFERHMFENPKRATTFDGAQTPPRIPAAKHVQKSALSQGFDRGCSAICHCDLKYSTADPSATTIHGWPTRYASAVWQSARCTSASKVYGDQTGHTANDAHTRDDIQQTSHERPLP